MAPPSRRRILPPEALSALGAELLFPTAVGADGPAPAASAPAARGGGAPGAPAPGGGGAVGIRIGEWGITSRNSSIGDEGSMEELTALLEGIANAPGGRRGAGGRRLCPPEITFSDAVVEFRHRRRAEGGDRDGEGTTTQIRFTARDALSEWAEAHRHLGMHPPRDDSSAETVRGVSIMRTVDAKIWSVKKPRNDNADSVTAAAAAGTSNGATDFSGNSEFYYDWTFSSPYAGTIITHEGSRAINGNNGISAIQPAAAKSDGGTINNRDRWLPLQRSRIPFHMLQDTNQPILLYDDIHLYEDDLHDNGDVSLNIKIRVMPRCWYVLQRLYVRVDHVCIKCYETRYFCLLDNPDSGSASSSRDEGDIQPNVIYRDVTWRGAGWEELGRLGLPTDPAAWREDSGYNDAKGGGGTAIAALGVMPRQPQAPPLAALLARLPALSLPDDLSRFAYFDVGGE